MCELWGRNFQLHHYNYDNNRNIIIYILISQRYCLKYRMDDQDYKVEINRIKNTTEQRKYVFFNILDNSSVLIKLFINYIIILSSITTF